MSVCVSVVIDDITSKIDKPYDYIVPDELASRVCEGARVVVPFSRSNSKRKALVIKVFESCTTEGLKQVFEISDEVPFLSDMQLKLVKLLKSRYFITYQRAFKTIVPRGVDFKINETYSALPGLEEFDSKVYALFGKKGYVSTSSVTEELKKNFKNCLDNGYIQKNIRTTKGIGDLSEKILTLALDASELDSYIDRLDKRFQRQIDLLSVFLDYSEISEKEALYYSGCSQSTVKTLERKGIIKCIDRKIERNPYKTLQRKHDDTPIVLTEEQNEVYRDILSETDKYSVHLINGVTGSGKTSVYMSLMDRIIRSGKSVIFMVPEISLTPQTLSKFYSRYGDIVSVVHSGLAIGERADEWRKIKNLETSLTVGTRSAVFSPVNNLGMIIIDEEHEYSYKSENSPKYHARDIAKYICKTLNIPLVLGSATPSIESSYLAKRSLYKYHVLTKRFNNGSLPKVKIIDMREAHKEGNQSFLSEELKNAIEVNLANSEQSILFLNRRGAHTMVGCRSCGYVAKCPNCGVALTYHLANSRCMCHYCGYNIKMFDSCPECSAKHIKKLGVGTQLVYSDLCDMFPGARILRMDFDTVNSYVSYGNKLNSFKNGEYDIMLGTQMVAKGLDFPNVTLVGVLNADLSLYIDDFRANERTFSLLTQVCGRSGRAGKEGTAYIQTYSPDNEIIHYAKLQNYDKYYDFEIEFRKAMNYPPFCDLIRFTVSNSLEKEAYSNILDLYKLLNEFSKGEYSDIPIRLLYPSAPKITKFNNKYRYTLVIKTRITKRLYKLLDEVILIFQQNYKSELNININPMNNV